MLQQPPPPAARLYPVSLMWGCCQISQEGLGAVCLLCKLEGRENEKDQRGRERVCMKDSARERERERERLQVQRANDLHRRGAVMELGSRWRNSTRKRHDLIPAACLAGSDQKVARHSSAQGSSLSQKRATCLVGRHLRSQCEGSFKDHNCPDGLQFIKFTILCVRHHKSWTPPR